MININKKILLLHCKKINRQNENLITRFLRGVAPETNLTKTLTKLKKCRGVLPLFPRTSGWNLKAHSPLLSFISRNGKSRVVRLRHPEGTSYTFWSPTKIDFRLFLKSKTAEVWHGGWFFFSFYLVYILKTFLNNENVFVLWKK